MVLKLEPYQHQMKGSDPAKGLTMDSTKVRLKGPSRVLSHRQGRRNISDIATRLFAPVRDMNISMNYSKSMRLPLHDLLVKALTRGGGSGSSVTVYPILRLSNHYPCLRRSGKFRLTSVS